MIYLKQTHNKQNDGDEHESRKPRHHRGNFINLMRSCRLSERICFCSFFATTNMCTRCVLTYDNWNYRHNLTSIFIWIEVHREKFRHFCFRIVVQWVGCKAWRWWQSQNDRWIIGMATETCVYLNLTYRVWPWLCVRACSTHSVRYDTRIYFCFFFILFCFVYSTNFLQLWMRYLRYL